MPAAAKRGDARSSILFFSMVLAFCAWVFSLPIFPSRDGPMHKYYVRVIANLLEKNSRFTADYAFRHPLPPYASHYLILFGLNKFLPINRAEECFVCIILFALGYGIRYCARSVGPGGNLISFMIAPLLLNFILFMGFFNYTLGIALSLFAAGLYLRAERQQPGLWALYVVVIALLAVTHPVPMLLLIVFLCLHLAVDVWNGLSRGHAGRGNAGLGWLKAHGARLGALAFTGLAFLYPVLAADRSRSKQNLKAFHFQLQLFLHFASLSPVMPYDPRSHGLWINLFRLVLYIVIGGCIVLAGRGFLGRLQRRELSAGDTFLFSSLVLMVTVPVIPEEMNGSSYFATRMLIFAVFGCVIAAAQQEIRSAQVRKVLAAFAVVSALFSLWMANHFIRPVSHSLVAIEGEQVPANGRGLMITDQDGLIGTWQPRLGIGSIIPYAWAGALPLIRTHNEILNPPWLDLTIMPLTARPDGTLQTNLLTPDERLTMGGPNDGGVNYMRPAERDRLIAEAKYIVFTGSPEDLAQTLPVLLQSDEAAHFACRPAKAWYEICIRQ